MASVLKSQKGFSLIELLTVVGILGVLAAVAIVQYGKYKLGALQSAQKVELIELAKALEYAHSVDGGYHPKIWAAGYRPTKNAQVNVGFPIGRGGAIGCASAGFPQNHTDAQTNTDRFLTLTAKIYDSNHLDSATATGQICNAGECQKPASGFPSIGGEHLVSSGNTDCASGFHGASNKPKTDCNEFITASSFYSRGEKYRAYINQKGLLCKADGWKRAPLNIF